MSDPAVDPTESVPTSAASALPESSPAPAASAPAVPVPKPPSPAPFRPWRAVVLWAIAGGIMGALMGVAIGSVVSMKLGRDGTSVGVPLGANRAITLGIVGAVLAGAASFFEQLLKARRERRGK